MAAVEEYPEAMPGRGAFLPHLRMFSKQLKAGRQLGVIRFGLALAEAFSAIDVYFHEIQVGFLREPKAWRSGDLWLAVSRQPESLRQFGH